MQALLDPLQATVLVVDDTPDNLSLMGGLLRPLYTVRVATHGAKALQIAASDRPPDLILLDVVMPGLDGFEVCRQLKANPVTADIPVIFLTSRGEVRDEEQGLALGAVDYLAKPVSPPIVLARIATHLALARARRFLQDKNAWLEAEVNRRVNELGKIQDIFGKVVDPRVRDYLLKTNVYQGGDVTEGAILFCDIRGFTAYAESRPPREVIDFLNRFFSAAAAVVEHEGGFINKFIGDAFLAVFGTPFPLRDYRSAALRAALQLRAAVVQLNADHPGEEPFRIGMGLHSGPMIAGIVGSPNRMEFTTIGDTVNTASRMESLCKEYAVDLMISGDALEGTLEATHAHALGTTALRGKLRTVDLYTV